MNEEQILHYLKELEAFFPHIFHQPNRMKKHLQFIRFFPEYEWFNVVSILMCYPNAKCVKSLESWKESCGKEIIPKTGEKGIPIVFPINIRGHHIEWKMIKGYDIEQLHREDIEYKIWDASLKEVIKKSDHEKIKNYFLKDENWHRKYIQYTMKAQGVQEKKDIQFYVENCCLFAIGELLEMSVEELQGLDMNFPDKKIEIEEAIRLYKVIKKVIASLPIIWSEIVSKQEVKEEEIVRQKELLYLQSQSIKELIQRARLVLDKRAIERKKQMKGDI